MKSELNDYKINNADGTSKSAYSEQQISFDNDNPRYIKENPLSAQKETVFVSETFDEPKKRSVKDNKGTTKSNDELSSVSSASSASTAASASSAASAASAASAVSGGISAIAGTVAASVASAVIVVAAFVSTLTINLSLLMATMTSLVFQVELSGAQEEDFATPIVAVLEGENDVYREQEIHIDSGYITFDDLEPSTEYVITVKNEEKVFFKKSYFTASEQTEKGFVSARFENGEVIVSLTDVDLKAGEYYTLTAKDDKGNVVFAKDDIEPNKEFTFVFSESADLYFALSVGGKTYSVSELKLRTAQYDFNNPVWTWADNFSKATLSFREIHGGEPLTVAAETTRSEVEPTCEMDGQYVYLATITYNDKQYSDTKTSVRENTALGHEYGEPQFVWEQGESGYSVSAIFVCTRDSGHVMTLPATASQDGDTFYAEVEYEGTVYRDEYVVNVRLSLNEGSIILYADGYSQNGVFTAFENTEHSRYIISGSRTADTPLKFHTKTYNDESVSGVVNFYVDFDNATVKGNSWASAVLINVYADVNVYINNSGTTNINPYNHPAFLIRGNSGYNVNIEVNSENGFNSFICSRQYSGTPTLYTEYDGATFYMNGDAYDNNGNRL